MKVPIEIMEEILAGHKKGDLLLDWLKDPVNKDAMLLDGFAVPQLVDKVVSLGYSDDLTDVEIEEIGKDPFLVACGDDRSL